MDKQYCVYIMTNKYNTTLYTGITSNLIKRAHEHKEKLAEGFSKRYDIDKLVYFEVFEDVNTAIAREKSIKDGPRKKKVELIVGMNPSWDDLTKNL